MAGSLLTPEVVHDIQFPDLGEEPADCLLVLLPVLNGPSPGAQQEKHGGTWSITAPGEKHRGRSCPRAPPCSRGTFSYLGSLYAGKTVTYQLLPHSIMVPG